jgi:hypothetical protein
LPDAAGLRAQWVKTFVARSGSSPIQFEASAATAGDAILVQVGCQTPATPPTAASITATGWNFLQVGDLVAPSNFYVATFAATAPDADTSTFTVTWTGAFCAGANEVGDDFTNNDMTGGTTTFDAFAVTTGDPGPPATLTTMSDDETIWAGCNNAGLGITAVGAGFTKATEDDVGDWSSYKVSNDPAGTSESTSFAGAMTNSTVIVAIKHR